MLKSNSIIAVLSVFLMLGFVSTASAGEGEYSNLLGTDEYVFNASETDAEIAAKRHVYDQKELGLRGSEAGNWEFTFDTPEQGGTGTMADREMNSDAKCSNC